MNISRIKAILKPRRRSPKRKLPESFLHDVSGVIHVGANFGQEREQYSDLGLQVIWIEPIPEIFVKLRKNISRFPNQRAFQELITDVDGKQYQFNISNNSGQSSSILELKQHKDIWPDVNFVTSITLRSLTLTSLLSRERIDLRDYQALILDTQGSELLVLQGSRPILESFKYIKTEAADFESYEGCCQVADLERFMEEHGYHESSRRKFATRDAGGGCYNIVYRKDPSAFK